MNKAENIKLGNIKPGMIKEFAVTVTEDMVNQFADLSGDFNPLHTEEDYAKSTKFNKRVAHGMLLASFFSRLVGMHLPGKRALYLSQNLRFKHPAFMGDDLKVVGKVMSISKKLRLITLKTDILNSSGEIIVEGEAKVTFLSDVL